MKETSEKALVRFLEDKEHLDVPGNSLLIFHRDKEIFRHYTGSVDKNTIFRIYSMTKVVTVTAALQLYEQGAFMMDEPLADYLPEYAHMTVWDEQKKQAVPADRPIRIRDLFCMSAGFPYEGEWAQVPREALAIRSALEKQKPGESYTTQEYIRALAKAPLAFEPGTHWMYGLSHDVLGALIEVLSHQTLGEYMREHIFQPLGMEHTFFRCPKELRRYMAEHSATEAEDAKFGETAHYESGGGGLLSTLDDYMRFANTLTRGGTSVDGVCILGRNTVDLMRLDQLGEEQKKDFNWSYLKGYSYGLGVRTYVDPAAGGVQGSVGEFGWCGVLGTWVLMDPEEQLTAVYMHQRYPNLEEYVQLHLRPLIYGALE
jgi:CubicO group peptidase (beta-lactamase class C family)